MFSQTPTIGESVIYVDGKGHKYASVITRVREELEGLCDVTVFPPTGLLTAKRHYKVELDLDGKRPNSWHYPETGELMPKPEPLAFQAAIPTTGNPITFSGGGRGCGAL